MEVKVTDWPESIVGLDGLIVGVVMADIEQRNRRNNLKHAVYRCGINNQHLYIRLRQECFLPGLKVLPM